MWELVFFNSAHRAILLPFHWARSAPNLITSPITASPRICCAISDVFPAGFHSHVLVLADLTRTLARHVRAAALAPGRRHDGGRRGPHDHPGAVRDASTVVSSDDRTQHAPTLNSQ